MVFCLRVIRTARLPCTGNSMASKGIYPGRKIRMTQQLSSIFITRMPCKCSSYGGRIISIGADSSLFRPEPHLLCANALILNTDPCEAYLMANFWYNHRSFLEKNSAFIREAMLYSGQKRSDWKSIYTGNPDALCSTRKNRNWYKRKGNYRKARCCFFVCTIFDSFLNDLSTCSRLLEQAWISFIFSHHVKSVVALLEPGCDYKNYVNMKMKYDF